MEGMEGSVSRTGIISMATLNTTLSISRHIPSPTCSPSPGQASPVLPTLLFQSYPHSGVQQQDQLQTHKEQLFPPRESNPCLWDLARMESKLGVTGRDKSICSVPTNICQKGNEKPSLGAMWLCS